MNAVARNDGLTPFFMATTIDIPRTSNAVSLALIRVGLGSSRIIAESRIDLATPQPESWHTCDQYAILARTRSGRRSRANDFTLPLATMTEIRTTGVPMRANITAP